MAWTKYTVTSSDLMYWLRALWSAASSSHISFNSWSRARQFIFQVQPEITVKTIPLFTHVLNYLQNVLKGYEIKTVYQLIVYFKHTSVVHATRFWLTISVQIQLSQFQMNGCAQIKAESINRRETWDDITNIPPSAKQQFQLTRVLECWNLICI